MRKSDPYTYNRCVVGFVKVRELFWTRPRTQPQYPQLPQPPWPLQERRYSIPPNRESRGTASAFLAYLWPALSYLEYQQPTFTFVIVSFAAQHAYHDYRNDNDEHCSHYGYYQVQVGEDYLKGVLFGDFAGWGNST